MALDALEIHRHVSDGVSKHRVRLWIGAEHRKRDVINNFVLEDEAFLADALNATQLGYTVAVLIYAHEDLHILHATH